MKATIQTYYRTYYRLGGWMIFISILSFTLGLFAIGFWGAVGAGILVIFGSFGIYQIIRGFWIVLIEQSQEEQKIKAYEQQPQAFAEEEIRTLIAQEAMHQRNKNYLLIGFLVGMLFLFLAAFGNWSELVLGIGLALAIQFALHLILSLTANYRASFYLLRLQKVVNGEIEQLEE